MEIAIIIIITIIIIIVCYIMRRYKLSHFIGNTGIEKPCNLECGAMPDGTTIACPPKCPLQFPFMFPDDNANCKLECGTMPDGTIIACPPVCPELKNCLC
jgi:hypothetical protein